MNKNGKFPLDYYMARITTLFSPYIEETISEQAFCAVQLELQQILTEMQNGGAK